jgi:hypothetical protein
MENETKFLSSEGLRHHIAKVKALVGSKANQSELDGLQDTVTGLSEAVGDSSDGLVKAVADNTAAIETEKSRAEAAEQELSNRINGIGSGMGDVTIDDELNINSANPIQNKAVATAIEGINGTLNGLHTVSQTGSYTDLSNKPTIPVVPIIRDDMEATFTLVDASSNPVITIAAPDGDIVINGQNIATAGAIDDAIATHNDAGSNAHEDIRSSVTTLETSIQTLQTDLDGIESNLENYATTEGVTAEIAAAKADLEEKIARRPRMYTATLTLAQKATVVAEAGSTRDFNISEGEIDLQGLFIVDTLNNSLTPDALLWLIENQRVAGLNGYFTYGSTTPTTVIVSKIAAVLDDVTKERQLVLIGTKYTGTTVVARVVYRIALNDISFSNIWSYDIGTSPIITLTGEDLASPCVVDFGENATRVGTTLTLEDSTYILVGENTCIDLSTDDLELNGKTLTIMGAGVETSFVNSIIIDRNNTNGGTIQLAEITVGSSNLEEGEID